MTGIYFGQVNYNLREREAYFRVLTKRTMNMFAHGKLDISNSPERRTTNLVKGHYYVKALLFKNYEI